MADSLSQINTLVAEIFTQIDYANDCATPAAAVNFWKFARQRLVKLRLLIATSPIEFQNELTRMKFNDSSNIMELLDQVEATIIEGESGIEGQALQRFDISLADEDGFTWTDTTTST